ncbi:MAG: hypothetical protein AAB601_02175 [Patescibacteria group bacterium]
MKHQYRFKPLSDSEREFLEAVLMDEVEVQSWYAVTYSSILAEEVFLTVQ